MRILGYRLAAVNWKGPPMQIDPSLVAMLACPKCKGPLDQVAEPEGFGCAECQLLFKTEDHIPNFLVEEAEAWER